jgi:excisionase family DNA binding protein
MAGITLRIRGSRQLGALLVLSSVLFAPMTLAKESKPTSFAWDVLTLNEAAQFLRVDPNELKQLASQNQIPARRIGAAWRFNRATLLAWLNGDWALITSATSPLKPHAPSPTRAETAVRVTNTPLSQRDLASVRATGTNGETTNSDPTPVADAANPEAPIGEAPKEQNAEDVFLRGQKVLLAPGQVAVDFGQFYSRNDTQQLADLTGGVGLGTIEQRTFTTLLMGRVGIPDETELFASTTYRNQNSDFVIGSSKIVESARSEIGDVRLGVHHTLLEEGPGRPNIIATIDGRIPTGQTSYAVGGGLVLVKSVDPVVLFANANYHYAFSRDFLDITRLEPQSQFDISMGYALALNDTLTVSTSVSGVFSGTTTFANAILRSQDVYSLSFGMTSWLAKGFYIEPTVSFGLGGPGNAVAFGITVPYTY